MIDSFSILRLYSNVLHEDVVRYHISSEDIRVGIQNMKDVYTPNPTSLQSTVVNVANYDDRAHRCAYLHKYAALHTDMVKNMMERILDIHASLFKNIVLGPKGFKLCSLGGGPGSDVIGVLAALLNFFNNFKISVTVVDCMENWKYTFFSVIQELSYGQYNPLIARHVAENLEWNYIGANLLSTMSDSVNKAVASATFITMIKFVSAAACTDTENMLNKIFRCMKPGALILFIDNAAGGFHQLVTKTAQKNNLISIFGPLRHENYAKPELEIKRFGYTSCYTTTVTVHLLKKPLNYHINKKCHVSSPRPSNQQINENIKSISVQNKNDKISNIQPKQALVENIKSISVQNENDKISNIRPKQALSSNILKPSQSVNLTKTVNTITTQPKINNLALNPSSSTVTVDDKRINNYEQYRYSPIHSVSSSVPSYVSVASTPEPTINNYSESRELVDDSEDICCSCCLIS